MEAFRSSNTGSRDGGGGTPLDFPLTDRNRLKAAVSRPLSSLGSATSPAHLVVVGGTGFIGSWLTQAWLDVLPLYVRFTVVSRSAERWARTNIPSAPDRFQALDSDISEIDRLPLNDVTHIVHAATPARPARSERDQALLREVLFHGAEPFLGFVGKQRNLKKLIYLSSGAVYSNLTSSISDAGSSTDGFLEDGLEASVPLAPENIYGLGKRHMERELMRFFAAGGSQPSENTQAIESKLVLLRAFSLLGPGIDLTSGYAASDFLKDALANRASHLSSDGTAVRTYMHPADAALAVYLVLGCDRRLPTVLNLGAKEPLSVRALAEKIHKAVRGICGRQAVQVSSDLQSRQSHDSTGLQSAAPRASSVYVPNLHRLEAELPEFKFEYDLDQCIQSTVDWLRARTDFTLQN